LYALSITFPLFLFAPATVSRNKVEENSIDLQNFILFSHNKLNLDEERAIIWEGFFF